MRPTADAVIIGAGVIGAGIAFELGKLGYKTINVDRLPAAGYGPTSNSCAIVRFYYSSWDGVAMAYEGAFYWLGWSDYIGTTDELGPAGYLDTGAILLKSQNGLTEKCLPHYDDLAIAYDEWTNDDLRRRFPLLDLREFWPPKRPSDPGFLDEPAGEIRGAVFTPKAGYVLDPQLATHNLQRAAEAGGGTFLFRRSVRAIRQLSERVAGVTLDDGTQIDAPIVVNVAGPHSFLINRLAGVEDQMQIKTRPLRHEVHHVPAPPDLDLVSHGCVISDGDLGIYYRPEVGGHILVGSEDPACDPRIWVSDPDTYDRGVSAAQWEAQVYRLAKRIPSLPIPTQRKGIVDLYDVSDDWMPIYDKSDLSGFYMAIGTSGNQFKNAPVAGHLMATLIDAVENGHDHDANPVRVKCRHIDADLDSGFYSRRRAFNVQSSYSVAG